MNEEKKARLKIISNYVLYSRPRYFGKDLFYVGYYPLLPKPRPDKCLDITEEDEIAIIESLKLIKEQERSINKILNKYEDRLKEINENIRKELKSKKD